MKRERRERGREVGEGEEAFIFMYVCMRCLCSDKGCFILREPPRWPSGSGVRLESERSRVRIPLEPGLFRVESYQWLQNWHSSGYPARRLAL